MTYGFSNGTISQEPCNSTKVACACKKPASCATDSQIGTAGTQTTYLNAKSLYGFSSYQTRAGCITLARKSGTNPIDLAWNQFPSYGVEEASIGSDRWLPAGRGGVFSFLPFLQHANFPAPYGRISDEGHVEWAASGHSSGSVTYYSPTPALPLSGRDHSGTNEFTELNLQTGESFVFGGSGHTSEGRLLRRVDRNGNTLTFNYSMGGRSSPLQPILRSITGDVSGVIPYFYYNDETVAAAPIRKIRLLDLADAANSRSTYFDYQSTTVAGDAFMQRVVFPGGCVRSYHLNATVADPNLGDCTAIQKEIDSDGYTTYFEYVDPSDPKVMRKTTEAGSRITYYDYTGGRTTKAFIGRPKETVDYTLSGFGKATNLHKWVDPLGNTTYYEYGITDRPTRLVEPLGGKVIYYEYDTPNGDVITKEITANNSATTETVYAVNGYDVRKEIGPRHVPGSFEVVTYFNYDGARNQTIAIDALNNQIAHGYDSDGRKRKTTDGRSNTTYFNFNGASGLLQSQVDPANQAIYFGYDSFANPTREVSPRWKEAASYAPYTTYHAYDSRNRRIKTRDALGNTSYFNYTNRNQLFSKIDARGVTTEQNSYDGLSNLKRRLVISLDGSTVVSHTYYDYDVYMNQVGITDANNNRTYHIYDAANRKVGTRDALNNDTYYAYDSRGNRIIERDQRGNITEITHDELNRVATLQNALGNRTYYGYDLANNRRMIRDAMANTTYFSFDELNRHVAVLNADNDIATKAYDHNGNVRKTSNELIRTTYFGYDELNRQVTRMDALGSVTYFGYDAVGNPVLARDANGHGVMVRYDTVNRTHAIGTADGAASYFGYDTVGNMVKICNQRNYTTYYEYDERNRISMALDPLNGSVRISRDAIGNRATVTDELNRTNYFIYDNLNRLHVMRNAIGNRTYYDYDAVGNHIRIRDSIWTPIYFFYDAVNRPSVLRDSLGHSTYFFYDHNGNRTKIRNASGNITYFTFDVLNRQTAVQNAAGDRTYFGYDAVGNRVRVRDGLGHNTDYRFDNVNRLTAIQDATGATVYYAYDAVGNRTKAVDQRRNTTYFRYDVMDRIAAIQDSLGVSAYYAYDAASNLHGTTDNNGRISYFVYDGLDRRTRIAYGGLGYGIQAYGISPYGGAIAETQYFEYDAFDNLTKAISIASTTSYRYDALNRIARKTSDSASAYFTYQVRGDDRSLLDHLHYPGSVRAYYLYDNAQNLSNVVTPAGNSTTYVRNAVSNRRKQVFGNGAICYYDYDNAERVSAIRHVTSGGSAIATFVYQRDSDSRITRITREAETIYYGYDNADRLTSEVWRNNAAGTQLYGFLYTYDAAGNRLKFHKQGAGGTGLETSYYSYAGDNSLTKRYVTPANVATYYTYDRNGSLIQQMEGSSITTFAYGPHGLITRITPPSGSAWEFAYDGQLARRKIVKAGTASYYLWNAFDQLEERDSAGTLRARYTHGDPIVPGVGSIVEVQRVTATTTYYQYLHMDHQGTVRAITNASQVVQARYTSDAFGSQIVAATGADTAIPNDLIFHSNWITVDTNGGRFCVSPSRLYTPAIGGFQERDPLSFVRRIAGAAMGNAFAAFDQTLFHGTLFRGGSSLGSHITHDASTDAVYLNRHNSNGQSSTSGGSESNASTIRSIGYKNSGEKNGLDNMLIEIKRRAYAEYSDASLTNVSAHENSEGRGVTEVASYKYPETIDGFVDGFSLYGVYYIPNSVDPTGLRHCVMVPTITMGASLPLPPKVCLACDTGKSTCDPLVRVDAIVDGSAVIRSPGGQIDYTPNPNYSPCCPCPPGIPVGEVRPYGWGHPKGRGKWEFTEMVMWV